MTQSVDELIELAASGDEEAAQALKNLYLAKEREAAEAARNLKLKTDTALRERYPRALRAFDKGFLKIDGSMTDDDMTAMLAAKEEEYAALGAGLDPAPTPQASAPSDGGEATGDQDPAKALGGARSASSPGGQPRDLVGEAISLYKKGTTSYDIVKAHQALAELNKNPATRAKVREITRSLEASQIGPTGF